ncbi:MAG TPA: hypothetical protein VLM84_13795, partial [Chromatiaceae bacterium]|nr:hypothetical protein [Chromatiaceae bacterium]
MCSPPLDLFDPPMLAWLWAVVGNLAPAIQRGLVQARLASSEAALREGEHQFRTLADAGAVLIGTSGVDRGCNYVNPRKEAELALAESEIRLRHTLENTPNVAVQWYD